MLKFAIVCWSPPERSLTRTGWIDVLDADAVDRDPARVRAALHVLDDCGRDSRALAGSSAFDGVNHTILVLINRRAARARRPACARSARSLRGPRRRRGRRKPGCPRASHVRRSRPARRPAGPAAGCPMRCRTSSTAEPAPPATTFSSSVTIARWLAAIAGNQRLVDRLDEAHVDERRVERLGRGRRRRPPSCRRRAARGRCAPRRRTSARPIGSACIVFSTATPGPRPRG